MDSWIQLPNDAKFHKIIIITNEFFYKLLANKS